MQYFYLRIVLFLTMIIVRTTAGVILPPNVSAPALIGFGDSIIDAGNNNDNKITLARSDFPPYGKDFMGGIATGRFSNGRVPTDLIAEAISIKRYVPAYRDPNTGPEDLLTGVTFASGAAGYDPITSKIAGVISLTQQLDLFKEYIGKVEELVGEERRKYIVGNSVYLVVCVANDIASNYFAIPLRKLQYDADSYATLLVNYASSFIQELYNEGARRIALFDAPPMGCLPSQRTTRGGFQRDCEENLNHFAQLFNSKLAAEVDLLNLKLPNSKIVVIQIYDILMEFIQNPLKYGFEEALKGCCGTGNYEVSIFCNRFDAVCEDDSKYLFWDSFHPTERGYELIDPSNFHTTMLEALKDLSNYSRIISDARANFIIWVNNILTNHIGFGLEEFEVVYYVNNTHQVDIDWWVVWALSRHVQRLVFDFIAPCVIYGCKDPENHHYVLDWPRKFWSSLFKICARLLVDIFPAFYGVSRRFLAVILLDRSSIMPTLFWRLYYSFGRRSSSPVGIVLLLTFFQRL